MERGSVIWIISIGVFVVSGLLVISSLINFKSDTSQIHLMHSRMENRSFQLDKEGLNYSSKLLKGLVHLSAALENIQNEFFSDDVGKSTSLKRQ
jgi:hypothetical protein